MSRDLVIKIELKALAVGIAVALLGVVSVKTIAPVKAATNLTGQYGCVTNKNFSGFTQWATWQEGNSTTAITGNNYLLYLDFDAGTASINVVGATKWGDLGVQGVEVGGNGGTLSIANGPITNTFTVSHTTVHNNTTWVTKYNLMPVNSGNTLLLQEGMGASASGEPNTGMCNKL